MSVKPLEGVRVVEVAAWAYVPTAGVVLADWGASVVKIEHPEYGDPMRSLSTGGRAAGSAGANFMWELTNRGKRSVAIDLHTAGGRDALRTLVERCDVFVTSFLPAARQKLEISEEHVRAFNPTVIYAVGSGTGPAGPESERGGYDLAAFWSRTGIADNVTPDGVEYPCVMPAIGFGDILSGFALAAGVGLALRNRDQTGEGCRVDSSLMATAMWAMSAEIAGTTVFGVEHYFRPTRATTVNPQVAAYRTKDGRFVQLVMLEADRHWADLCGHLDRPDLVDDPRFATSELRAVNAEACVSELDAVFATRDLAEWRARLETLQGVWAVVQRANELVDDHQAVANGYVRHTTDAHGNAVPVVSNPVQLGGGPPDLVPAPEHGEHTELELLDAGFTWDQLAALKDEGAIL
jgi:crotonobetainyl-CoA:carnitine CoA-transferase CaiB-like acyl-CoA transferase